MLADPNLNQPAEDPVRWAARPRCAILRESANDKCSVFELVDDGPVWIPFDRGKGAHKLLERGADGIASDDILRVWPHEARVLGEEVGQVGAAILGEGSIERGEGSE